MEDHTGARWYCTEAGVAREVNGSIERLQPYGIHVELGAYRAYEDAQGNVWLNLAGGCIGLPPPVMSLCPALAPGTFMPTATAICGSAQTETDWSGSRIVSRGHLQKRMVYRAMRH
jgi:hypothetical protein